METEVAEGRETDVLMGGVAKATRKTFGVEEGRGAELDGK